MSFSDDQIRKIARLKDDLNAEVEKHREAIELLEDNLEVLDMVLKKSSFAKASSLMAQGDKAEPAPTVDAHQDDQPIPIAAGNGKIVARAHVTPGQVSIILDDAVDLGADTPPFKSFFIDRIIGGMRKKDASEADAGKIRRDSVIDCTLDEAGSRLSKITVSNYRHKERVNELISTAGWSFGRMLENAE